MRGVGFLSVGLAAFISGCAPPGYQSVGYSGMAWPSADQPLPAEMRYEIEFRLNAIGYRPGPVDGVVSPDARDAIRRYQRDIGAPANGYLSVSLLESLRFNSGSVAVTAPEIRRSAAPVAVAAGQVPAPPTGMPGIAPSAGATTRTRGGDGSDGGGGGGGGGDDGGGGSWN